MVLSFCFNINSLYFCLFAFHWLSRSTCLSHSSFGSLSKFLKEENGILDEIRKYQQIRLLQMEHLQRKVKLIEQVHKKAAENVTIYLSNPINAYQLIKRAAVDWEQIHEFITSSTTTKEFHIAYKYHMDRVDLPTEKDLQAAIHGLENSINKNSSAMTWDECYEIGTRFFGKKDFNRAVPWLKKALVKMKEDDDFNELIKTDIMKNISYSQHQIGKVEEAFVEVFVNETISLPLKPAYSLERPEFVSHGRM